MSPLRWIQIAFVPLLTGLTIVGRGCGPPCPELGVPAAGQSFAIDGFGTITTLGGIGSHSVEGTAMNAAGQVVGTVQAGCGQAVVLSDGVLTDMGSLGAGGSEAYDINGLGQVVGKAGTGGIARAIPFVPTIPGGMYFEPQYLAFIWQDGAMASLGTLPGGVASGAVAINDVGQVVGWAELPFDAAQETTAKVRLRAFMPAPLPMEAVLWEYVDGVWQIRALSTLALDGFAEDINNLGQIVGSVTIEPDEPTGEWASHAYVWSDSALTDLGTLGGPSSGASAINDVGQVVGWSETAELLRDPDWPRRVEHAFLWQDGEMIDLGTLGGDQSIAQGINNLGQAVGWSETSESVRDTQYAPRVQHAFLWEGGSMTDLNDLLPPNSEWEIWSAVAINDAGQIVGTASRSLGLDQFGYEQAEWHSVLITLEP